jgi:hypothetical protein
VAELKESIARNQSDIAGLKRELSRFAFQQLRARGTKIPFFSLTGFTVKMVA